MKKTFWFIVMMLLVMSLASCAGQAEELPSNALAVICPLEDISYILPGNYPDSYAEDGETFKWGYNVYVSRLNEDDRLVLGGNRNEGLADTSRTGSGTYYQIGDWFGYRDGVFLGEEKVISEKCVGMVASRSGKTVLIITGTEDNSYVYSARLEGEQWILDRQNRLELGSKAGFVYYNWPIHSAYSPSETMYIVTEKDLVMLSVGEYLDLDTDFSTVTKAVVETPAYWHYLRPTSAVEINGKLYIGDRFGVLEYAEDTKELLYYPIDIKAQK